MFSLRLLPRLPLPAKLVQITRAPCVADARRHPQTSGPVQQHQGAHGLAPLRGGVRAGVRIGRELSQPKQHLAAPLLHLSLLLGRESESVQCRQRAGFRLGLEQGEGHLDDLLRPGSRAPPGRCPRGPSPGSRLRCAGSGTAPTVRVPSIASRSRGVDLRRAAGVRGTACRCCTLAPKRPVAE